MGWGSGWWEGNSESPYTCATLEERYGWHFDACSSCHHSGLAPFSLKIYYTMALKVPIWELDPRKHSWLQLAAVGIPFRPQLVGWVPRSGSHPLQLLPKSVPRGEPWTDPYKMLRLGEEDIPFPRAPARKVLLQVFLARNLILMLTHGRHWW